jgi:HAD superfamily hydrolase (TIGR01459 family)
VPRRRNDDDLPEPHAAADLLGLPEGKRRAFGSGRHAGDRRPPLMREIAGLATVIAELQDELEGVLLDQFGVLHDGRTAFPEALEAVRRLRARGLKLAVLSNSGKMAAANAARLARLGFPAGLFDVVLSSGELCRLRLDEDLASGRLAPGARVLVIASGSDALPTDGLPLSAAARAEEADLVLVAGRDPARRSLEEDLDQLRPAALRGVPCLCANPDLTIYGPDGAAPGPGRLAAAYAAAGGPVELFGKPHADIFRRALALLGGLEASRVLMIGDSLEHDIAGAARIGCRTLFVRSGVQSDQSPTEGAAAPEMSMPRLCW